MSVVEKFIDKLTGFLGKIENSHTANCIKRSFTFLLPIFLVGATALTLQNFPITPVREFINSACNGYFNAFLNVIYTATYGFASSYLVLAFSYCFSQSKNLHGDVKVFTVLTSILCYFASLGKVILRDGTSILSYTNMSNIFPAMISSIVSTKLFLHFYKVLNRTKLDHSSSFARSLHSILPLACCVVIFTAVASLFNLINEVNNFNDIILYLIARPFESIGATYFGGVLILLAESFLWFFGIHGGNAFDGILNAENGAFAFSNGQIMSKPFIDTFALLGGCGATACMFIAILIFTKDARKKKLCKLAGVPLLFNINELLVFGLPIVLNPIYLIPFLIAPILCYTVAYLAVLWGIVPQIVNASVQWTTPIIISGYQATGSIAGSILQIIQLAIGVAVYAPFVILDNRTTKEHERQFINELTDIYRSCEASGVPYSIDNKKPSLATFEDSIATKLFSDIRNHKIYLRYQPQVDNGKVVSAEALLRFKLDDDKYLYPPLVIAIACKNGLFNDLSQEIVSRAITDLTRMQLIDSNFKIAVNLKLDVLMNYNFRGWLIESIRNSDLTFGTFGVEITEDANISDAEDYANVFNELKQVGIEIYMDDFSMGHTSVSILQKNYFDYIKIDGNLIKQLDNERIRSIVSSIIKLGSDLNFNVIAEYVETEKQRDVLLGMGCHIFQGYLYYKDLDAGQIADVLRIKA